MTNKTTEALKLAEQDKQEPVAWMHKLRNNLVYSDEEMKAYPYSERQFFTPLYAAPVSAKREWVDLTDDEIQEACINYEIDPKNYDPLGQYRAVIAAWKEKNK